MTKKIITIVCSVLVMGLSTVSLAQNAPVVDVTQDAAPQNAPLVPEPAAQNNGAAQASPGYEQMAGNASAQQTQPAQPAPQFKALTAAARLSRLETQMANLTSMNLPQQVSNMQEKLQALQGQLQVQQHDLAQLSTQMKSFYQDLDRRVGQLKTQHTVAPQEDAGPTTAKAAPQPINIPAAESTAYQAAFKLMVKRNYKQAIKRFDAYIDKYDKGHFVVNAHYWLGEIYMIQKNNAKAADEFGLVISDFPKSSKVPDAQLKLAVIHLNAGRKSEAKKAFLAIKKRYPNSTAAQLATIQLQQMDASS